MSVLDLQGMESAVPSAVADGGHSHSSNSCHGGGSSASLLLCNSGLSVAICHN